MLPETRQKRLVEQEAEFCARLMFVELTGGRLARAEPWYVWFLCERHGGAPLVDAAMRFRQVAYWDGEDIVIDGRADPGDVIAALPEELAHRLSSRESARFEPLNFALQHAHTVERAAFQEMVGQRVAALFVQARERTGL